MKMIYNYPKANLNELFKLVIDEDNEPRKRRGSEFGLSFQIVESQMNFMNRVN